MSVVLLPTCLCNMSSCISMLLFGNLLKSRYKKKASAMFSSAFFIESEFHFNNQTHHKTWLENKTCIIPASVLAKDDN